jgi:colanic acid/amylovoran biosynthesis glycosyltransferase
VQTPTEASAARSGPELLWRSAKASGDGNDPRVRPVVGVAHFRRIWFKPTESFLHNLITGSRRTRPLLVGHERVAGDRFPVECPWIALHPPGSLRARWLEARTRWLGGDPHASWASARLRRALRRHGTAVLHAHFGYTGHQILAVKAQTGLPLVTSFYGEDASALPREPGWPERYAELFARGDRFLVEGPVMRQRLVALGCRPEKIAIQPIAIPVARYPFRERRRRPEEPARLLFCGSLREKKGLVYALEALARVRADHGDVTLRVAGDGPERAKIERELDRLDLRGAVEMLGSIPHEQFVKELELADLFVQPSVTARNGDSEGGAPTTLLEAQACGVPVLSTTHADIPNVVGHGESGLLAPERNAEVLASHLELLLEEPERWPAMGRAGRARVLHFHDTPRQLERLEDLYLSLAGERR